MLSGFCSLGWYPHSLFLTNDARPDGMPTKIKWKIHVCYITFQVLKYVLVTTSSFVSFCFTLAFTPLTVSGVALIWKPFKCFAQQTGWLVSVWGQHWQLRISKTLINKRLFTFSIWRMSKCSQNWINDTRRFLSN